ncbi:MAG: polysaccharide pyruvyl transferase family protein [Candidatus Gastranaerophilales bacterium]|nr:polysaccharide pyruvyl transferase family protein [Candidatus Gastranaerophilales bacterium]
MKKEKISDVGIISFSLHSDGYNFGAALHSFAFQKYLDKIGVDNVIINYFPKSVWRNCVLNDIFMNIIKFQFISMFKNIIKLFFILIKKKKFHNFFKRNCNITNKQYNVKSLEKLNTISRFVCETDVTWAHLKGGYDRGFLCDLPNMKNKKNVAYSVDFGSKDISFNDAILLKKYAKNFDKISIRNIFKLDYFKNIVDRNDITITIDPVFLIDSTDYVKIAEEIKYEKDYVLVYNCQENNTEMIEKAYKYAKENSLDVKIINCFMNNYQKIEDSYPTLIGIEKVLGLIKNCKFLFTNSYHGICFGIIFEKEFFAFSRKANNEKILTVLRLFNLENRLINDKEIMPCNIDYISAKNFATEIIQKSKLFIEDALKEKILGGGGNP